MIFFMGFTIGALVGGIGIYIWMNQYFEAQSKELAEFRATALVERKEKELSRAFFEDSTKLMKHEFNTTASELLTKNVKELRLDTQKQLEPLMKELKRLHEDNESLKERHSSFSTKIQDLQKLTRDLNQSTVALSEAMKGGKARGRWAEIALRNVLERSDLTENIDFEEQVTTGEGLRPDFVVRLPGHGFIAIDSKAPADDYLLSLKASNEAERVRCENLFIKRLRHHIKSLGQKDYASGIDGDLDFTVLFLPGDGHLATMYRAAPELLDEAWKLGLVMASPTTLMALLRVIALQWQHHRVNAELGEVNEAIREFYKRLITFGSHLESVGSSLGKAVDAFNSTVGSYKKRLVPFEKKLPVNLGSVPSETVREIEDYPNRLEFDSNNDTVS